MRPITAGDERTALPLPERTLLWSMRAWVVGLCRPEARVQDGIETAFAELGAPAAAGYLDGFMWVLRHGALRTIGVDCPCNPRLDADERALLGVFAHCQHEDGLGAALLLRGMVNPRAAWVLLDSAGRVGSTLTRRGRMLTLPGPRHPVPFSPLRQPAPPGTTLH